MANQLYRDNSPNGGLPHIMPRPLSAGFGYDARRSASFDPIDRHVRFNDSLYQTRRNDVMEQSQIQEQLRQCRDEIAKKDKLIAQIAGSNGHYPKMEDSWAARNPILAPAAQVGLHMKMDSMNQVRELQMEIDMKDDKIRKLQLSLEAAKDAEVQNVAQIQQLRRQLMLCESQTGNFQDVTNRSSMVITTLQQDTREAQQRVLELESRLRTHLEEREKAEQDRASVERKLIDLTSHLTSLLFLDIVSGSNPLSTEDIMQKTEEMVQENAMLKGKMASMKEFLANNESEQRANRETIMRLTAEADRIQNSVSRNTLDMDNLRVERDNAISKQEDLQKEIDVLKDRLEASQRAWSSMKKELDDQRHHQHHQHIEQERNWIMNGTDSQKYAAFKDNLAKLLSDGYVNVEPYEEPITARIQSLVLAVRDKNAHIETLEGQLANMATQLEKQYELNRMAERKSKHVEADLADMEEKLRRTETSASVEGILKNGYTAANERYVRLLDRISRALGMPPLAPDLSIEAATDAVIQYAEQLAQNSADASRKTHIYNLQRKVKSLKEQLACKESQLQEKIASLEERLALSADKEDEFARNRKLVKLLDKYKMELNEAHLEIRQLKSRLLDADDLQSRAMAREQDLEHLEAQVSQLEHVRQKQASQIASLEKNQNSVGNLSNELRTTKAALDELTRHHRQLLDLRQVIGRMLGLNVHSVAVVDFEIISRLEKLIIATSQDSNITSTFTIDASSTHGVAEEFRRGYEADQHHVSRQPTTSGLGSSAKVRSRSLSPQKKRDPKVY